MRKTISASPGSDELHLLFDIYASQSRIALAVSGGSDSMALMYLSAAWQSLATNAKPDVIVLTVDHGLRADAAQETRSVASAAKALGLPCHILTRAPPATKTAIQADARTDRYRMLCEAARQYGADAIATGHTADDQAETLLMRLARGSGVDGLAAMAPVSRIEDLALLRPLLGCSKRQLQEMLTKRGVSWTEDPSNTDPTFERPRLRTPGLTLSAAGLTREPLALSARRIGRARAALEAARDAANREMVTLHPEGWISVPRASFDALPEEIRIRLLGYWLSAMATSQGYQRLSAVETIVDDIATNGRVVTTLSGCRLVATRGSIDIIRETGRIGLPQLDLLPGQTLLWDRRFKVQLPSGAASGVRIRAVQRADLEAFLQHHSLHQTINHRILPIAPAAFRDGQLVACPILGVEIEPVLFELVLPDPQANGAA
jgi:tRNA(Ile)-lysidine synthase